MIGGRSIVGGEFSTDDDFAVRLHKHAPNLAVGARADRERGVQRSVSIYPGNIVALDAVVGSEAAANHHLVAEHAHRPDKFAAGEHIDARTWIDRKSTRLNSS